MASLSVRVPAALLVTVLLAPAVTAAPAPPAVYVAERVYDTRREAR